MDVEVFKFGGASVNSALAVQNMASIVKDYYQNGKPMLIVVSAMGKTTNALERLIPGVSPDDEKNILYNQLYEYHLQIVRHLFRNPSEPVYKELSHLFEHLKTRIYTPPTSYNFDYDQVVSFGEIISTTIISHYLHLYGVSNEWFDVRNVIITDNNYRSASLNWNHTLANAPLLSEAINKSHTIVTQGFIASSSDGHTTTLGREGSDYTAAILSYLLDSPQMTIWKDVPGFLNADPKYFNDTIKINQIPYNEAIELAYYGASVIHPKTVKPLQNKQISLRIKSFVNPTADGSVIGPYTTIDPLTPLYIFKDKQVLVSIMPKDFSFIAEDNLQYIFSILSQVGISVNLMQNSALSFSICIDYNKILLDRLLEMLSPDFKIRYNCNMQLITIRYYNQEVIDRIVARRPIYLEQRSRITAQIVVESSLTE